MADSRNLRKERLDIEVDGVQLSLAVMRREGRRTPLFFLHGFGSTKEDYADAACLPQFDDRAILAYDAPGFGESYCADLSSLSIPFLRRTAERVLQHYGVDRYHLIGHSMGGLTGLMLADAGGSAIRSFADIEGNLAPEDCFLSRQVVEHPADDPEEFLKAFAERAWHSPDLSSPFFASTLLYKVRAGAVAPIFCSMVDITDNDDLLTRFAGLRCAKMFVYGERNRSLSYLGALMRRGVQLAEIEQSGHWPMYANAPALWSRLAAFVDGSETESFNG